MSNFMKFAPGGYKGEKVYLPDLKRKSERQKLVGKKIGYDIRGSCMMHFGWVTGVSTSRGSIEINESDIDLSSLEQIVVLSDQDGAR